MLAPWRMSQRLWLSTMSLQPGVLLGTRFSTATSPTRLPQVLGTLTARRPTISTRRNWGLKTESTTASTDKKFLVRPTEERDLQSIHQLTVEENWNYNINDIRACYNATRDHPEGFLVAELDGRVVGTCIANVLSEDVCIGGLFVVTKPWRGQGAGRALFTKRLEVVGQRQFVINAVKSRTEANKKLGFVAMNWNWGWSQWVADASLLSPHHTDGFVIRDIKDSNFDELLTYDSCLSKLDRKSFLQIILLEKPNVVAKMAYDGNKVVGYGAVHPSFDGHRLAPLYADNKKVAENLLKELMTSIPQGNMVDAYIYMENENCAELIGKLRPLPGHEVTHPRMYLRQNMGVPGFQNDKVYALSSAEMNLL